MLRRPRFTQLVEAQLDIFLREHSAEIDEVRDRLDAYNRADRGEAEELYGDYADALDAVTDSLVEMRDHYASDVDDPEDYVRTFDRAVSKRLPEHKL
jgi:hypothetical protein